MQQLKVWLKNRNYSWSYKLRVCLPIFIGLISIDWITKFLATKLLAIGESSAFIPGFLRIHYVINFGSAYGYNNSRPALAITLATLITGAMLIIFLLGSERKWLVGLSFITSGSMGNLLGRTWSPAVVSGAGTARGGVIDFLQWDFSFLGANNYIFNLADVFVIAGTVMILIILLAELWKTLRHPSSAKASTPTSASIREEKREIE